MERNSTSGMPIWGLTLVFLGLLPFGTWCGPRWATAAPAQPVYNVTDFGANGSDNEDDTSAFKAALAAAQKNAQVNVPPGVYIISDALSVAAGVRLEGAGMQRTQLQVALAEDAEKIENFISTDGSGTEIVDLEIDGGGHVENIIRSSGGASNLLIQRCRLHHATRGIEVDRTSGQFLDNVVHDMAHPGFGIGFLHECKFLEIRGNRIFDCHTGIQCWGLFTAKHQDTRSTKGYPDDPGACSRIIIANNRISRTGGAGIFGAGLKDSIIVGNVCEDGGDYGIDLEWCYKVSVTGNFTRACTPAGIAMFIRTTQCTVTGNTVNMRGMPRGIWLSKYSHHNVVSGNTCAGLPVGAPPGTDREKKVQMGGVTYVDAGIGIDVWMSSHNTITGNLVDGVDVGIYVGGSERNVITGNRVTAHRDGLYLHRTQDNLVTSNFLDVKPVKGERGRVIILNVEETIPWNSWNVGKEGYPCANNIISDNILAGGELTIFEAPGTVGPAGNRFTDNLLINASKTPFQLDPTAAAVERNNQRRVDVTPKLPLEGLRR